MFFLPVLIACAGDRSSAPPALSGDDPVLLAERAVDAGDYATAMRYAMQARSQPRSLDDTRASRRIDRTIERITASSDEQIQSWLTAGRYLDALDLAHALEQVDPNQAPSARRVEARSAAHFRSAASQALESGHLGAASLSLSLARRAGDPTGDFEPTWGRFRDAHCYSEPQIVFLDEGRVTEKAREHFRQVFLTELEALRSRCGPGGQPLRVNVSPALIEFIDRELEETAGMPVPGYDLELEAPLVETIPYSVVEEVTRMESVTEEVERRDCAPRPGKSGCEVWTEEVTKEVAVRAFADVQKTKRLEWTRSSVESAAPEQFVGFPAKRVERRIVYLGRFSLAEGPALGGFDVVRVEADRGHAAVRERGVSLPADPLEARTLEVLVPEADRALAEQIRSGIAELVTHALAPSMEEAAERSRSGDLNGAEDRYLRALVLGGPVTVEMDRFFQGRYGQSTVTVTAALIDAIGRGKDRVESDLFPTINKEDSDGQQ